VTPIDAPAVSPWPAAVVQHVDVRLDLHPDHRVADVTGAYHVVNPHAEPLTVVPLALERPVRALAWIVDGQAAVAGADTGSPWLGVRLPARLQPGAVTAVGFRYRIAVPAGPTRHGGPVEQAILPSAVILHTLRESFLPVWPAVARPDTADGPSRARPAVGPAGPFTARLTISAPADLTVLATGVQTASDVDEGRQTVVWESEVPVRAINVVAGRWVVTRGLGVAVYHHRDHPWNVAEIRDALAAARTRYTDWFGPYPWPELRLSELPDLATLAQGFPTNITMSEGLGWRARSVPGQRLPFLVAAHEAAHQWWGNLVNPADAPGADALIEGLANYAALRLTGVERGESERRALARRLERQYLQRRRVDREQPLRQAIDDGSAAAATVVFDRGAWAFWMLERQLGWPAMRTGLREFFAAWSAAADGPFATVDDLLTTLGTYAEDPGSYQRMVARWFDTVGVPELRVQDAAVRRHGPGRWRATATVGNVGTGAALVEVAVLGDTPDAVGEILARQVVDLEPDSSRALAWEVARRPRRIVVDPGVHVLQRGREHAVAELVRDETTAPAEVTRR
jgi:hypothetical protein